jgi:hypothetical protein
MVVEKSVPCFLRVMDFPVLVRHCGQPFQCYRCQRIGHSYKDCPDKAKPSAHQQVTNPPPSSPISGPHTSKFPLQPTPLVITGCQPAGTSPQSVLHPATAVIPSTAQSSSMEVVPRSSLEQSSTVAPLLVTSDGCVQSAVGDSSEVALESLPVTGPHTADSDSNVQTEERTYQSVASWTGPLYPVLSVRFWLRKDYTPSQRHVIVSMQDLMTGLMAAYKEGPASGRTIIHWQMVKTADITIPPMYTFEYDQQGQTIQLLSTKRYPARSDASSDDKL